MKYTLEEIAKSINAEVIGDSQCLINGVASLSSAGQGDITFLSNPSYRKYLADTSASAVLISAENTGSCSTNALVVENPYFAYAQVAQMLYPKSTLKGDIHPTAVISDSSNIDPDAVICEFAVIEGNVRIGKGAYVGPHCVVGEDSVIGADSCLTAQVVIRNNCEIGRRALIHSGVVIGSDGFGFAENRGEWLKIPQIGRVVMGDDVEIGANTAIDRGALDDTIIGRGVKLDNLIQIGHNVTIGENTAIAACTAIAGSTRIGKRCAIGGCVGIVGHLEITDDVHITGMSMVTHSILNAGVYSSGTPLEENTMWRKNFVRMKQLDELTRRVKMLERNINK
ncbi:MAG: UDP-3-O-(3-hydroxymyristoyl)glucosamine N-acyltransferase [Gammaproteobacteria bacterium]